MKGRTEREYEAETEGNETEKKSNAPKSRHRFWASERVTGEFQRTFSFPTRVDQNAVKASLKNGILSVVVPKATASLAKKITVE